MGREYTGWGPLVRRVVGLEHELSLALRAAEKETEKSGEEEGGREAEAATWGVKAADGRVMPHLAGAGAARRVLDVAAVARREALEMGLGGGDAERQRRAAARLEAALRLAARRWFTPEDQARPATPRQRKGRGRGRRRRGAPVAGGPRAASCCCDRLFVLLFQF